MKINLLLFSFLLVICLMIYYDKNKIHTHLSIYLVLLILLYLILLQLPNLEHFSVYNNSDQLLNLYSIPSEEIIDNTEILSETNNEPVLYGDVVLIKSLSKEKRYLSGGRGGNVLTETGQLNENVFCTDEIRERLEWIIKSIDSNKEDPKKGQPIKYGDNIFCKVKNVSNRYLRGGVTMKFLPYSINENQAVLTISRKYNTNNNLMWIIKSDTNNSSRNNIDTLGGQIVNYSDDFVLQSNAGNDLFLSGARGMYMLDNENDDNQQVLTVNSDDGNFELKWCFVKDKVKIDLDYPKCTYNRRKWPIWDFEPGFIGKNNWKNMITASSSIGYTPFTNNIKQPRGHKSSDKVFGEPCIGGFDNNACWQIGKSGNGWVAGDNTCRGEFVVLNFGKEVFLERAIIFPRKDYPHTNQFIKEFSVKTATKNGIFLDLNYKFITNFGIEWFKTDSKITISTYNNLPLKMLNSGTLIESNKNINVDSASLQNETFRVIKNQNNTVSFVSKNETLIKANDDMRTVGQSSYIRASELDTSYDSCKYNILEKGGKYAFRTIFDTYLTFNNGQIMQSEQLVGDEIPDNWQRELFLVTKLDRETQMQFEFKINRTLQYLKIIPLKSNIGCAMRISAFDKNSNLDLIELLQKNVSIPIKSSSCMNFKNGRKSELTEGDVCTYGGYETKNLNMFSGSGWSSGSSELDEAPFLIVDLEKERCIRGGIIYGRDNYEDTDCLSCDQYVKKFKVQVAGNNKQYREIGTYITDFQGNSPGKNKGYKFPIYKQNIRYVKLIVLQCNKYCSMRLDIY